MQAGKALTLLVPYQLLKSSSFCITTILSATVFQLLLLHSYFSLVQTSISCISIDLHLH